MSEQKTKIENIIKVVDNMRKIINHIASNIDSLNHNELIQQTTKLSAMRCSLGGFESELEYSLKVLQMNKRIKKDDTYSKLKESEEHSQEDCKILARKAIRALDEQELKLKSLLMSINSLKQDSLDIIAVVKNKPQKQNQHNLFII